MDLFDKITEALDKTPEEAKLKKKGRTGNPATKKGHVKARLRQEAEADPARKEFIDNFESLTKRKSEPKRMIVALSLPPEEQKQALEDAMTPRQLAFCREYVIDFNDEKAALRAGYAPSNAKNTGYTMRQIRGVRRLIEIYTESNAQKITTIDKDYVVNKVTEIVATANKDSDKLRGLELLARYLGMFIDRTEITGKDGEAIKVEETRQAADEVARQLRAMAGKASPLSVIEGGKKEDAA